MGFSVGATSLTLEFEFAIETDLLGRRGVTESVMSGPI